MNSQQRHHLRHMVVRDLRETCENNGGDAIDGVVILMWALMQVHASVKAIQFCDAEAARENLLEEINEHYPSAYALALRAMALDEAPKGKH